LFSDREARVSRYLKKAEEVLGVVLFCTILVSILWQIVSRYFFNAPPSWTEELSRFLFIYMGTIGVHLAQGDYGHVRIDMLVTAVPAKVRKVMESIILLVCSLSMMVLAWFSLWMAIRKAPIQLVSLGISSGFMYINAVLVSLLSAATTARQLILVLSGRGRDVYSAEPAAAREV